VSVPLLYEYFLQLPPREADEEFGTRARRYQAGMEKFKTAAGSRYTEGTLLRLLHHGDPGTRKAAVLALGLTGTMRSNRQLARALHDSDAGVRETAGEALWSLWFRADTPENNQELQRLVQRSLTAEDAHRILIGYAALLKKAPRFAEAFNQRAIYFFRQGEFAFAAADCETALRLNPVHFGAASGLGQCLTKLRKLPAALRAYRRALRINPNLEGVQKIIRSLEKLLGGEGRR
jgi:tetratricopeptide (TPR) repeat protein